MSIILLLYCKPKRGFCQYGRGRILLAHCVRLYVLFLCGKKKDQKEAIGGDTPLQESPRLSYRNYICYRVIAHDGYSWRRRDLCTNRVATYVRCDDGRGCLHIVCIRLCKGIGIRRAVILFPLQNHTVALTNGRQPKRYPPPTFAKGKYFTCRRHFSPSSDFNRRSRISLQRRTFA